ncbi:MAG TPA: hypothetical protein VFZ69_10750 [Longimicrobiales bacterium]
MSHRVSAGDRQFATDLAEARIAPGSFDHRAHVRLAYTYLVDRDDNAAAAMMRDTLLRFLEQNGVDTSKYHETITRAWILAVRHFMAISPPCTSADEFIDRNPILLDRNIMLSHYSADLLFSPAARTGFVEPDLEQIPKH